MGSWFSRLFNFTTEKKLLMLGLDAAGKTTILYKLKLGENVTSIPTIGFNVEEVSFMNLKMSIWDIGGQDKIRPLWKHYFDSCDGLIFVVDSADTSRIGEAKDELMKLHRASSIRNDVPFLIIANKQDLPTSKGVHDICEGLGCAIMHSRKWYIQGCCAVNGEGLYEGLTWLRNEMMAQPKK